MPRPLLSRYLNADWSRVISSKFILTCGKHLNLWWGIPNKEYNFNSKLGNMSCFVCPHCGEKTHLFGEGVGERVASTRDVPFLGSLPLDPEVAKTSDSGRPFVAEKPESAAAKAFIEIVKKIVDFVGD